MLKVLVTLFCVLFSPLIVAQNNAESAPTIMTSNQLHDQNSHMLVTGSQINTYDPNAWMLVGGIINISQGITHNAIIVGGKVNLDGSIKGNVALTGGDVVFSSVVSNHSLLIGGNLNVTPKSSLQNDSILIGGNVNFSGDALDDMVIVGGNVNFSGKIKGDLKIIGDNIVIGPTSHIAGHLSYSSSHPLQLDKAATVTEGISSWKIGGETATAVLTKVKVKSYHWHLRHLFFDISIFLLGILMILITPNLSNRAIYQFRSHLFWSFIIGVLFLLLIPVSLTLLTFSIIGIPLAFLLMLFYTPLLMVAYLIMSMGFGALLIGLVDKKLVWGKWELIFSLFMGILLVHFIQQIPYVGILVCFLGFLVGLGGALRAAFKHDV